MVTVVSPGACDNGGANTAKWHSSARHASERTRVVGLVDALYLCATAAADGPDQHRGRGGACASFAGKQRCEVGGKIRLRAVAHAKIAQVAMYGFGKVLGHQVGEHEFCAQHMHFNFAARGSLANSVIASVDVAQAAVDWVLDGVVAAL